MNLFSFGNLEVKTLCKWLWILTFFMIFLRNQSLYIGIFEGISPYLKLKFYFIRFYLQYLEPIFMLLVLKFIFELVYKFYLKIGNSTVE